MNHQSEEPATEGTSEHFDQEQMSEQPEKMSVDNLTAAQEPTSQQQQQTETSGGGKAAKVCPEIYFQFYLGIKISEMINNEPVDDEEGEEGEQEAPPSTNQSSTSLASTTSSQASSSAPPQLNDAFAYLDKVRNEFADQPEIYNKFLQTMREFKANT